LAVSRRRFLFWEFGWRKEVDQMALDNGCRGGGHGIPIPHGGDIASRSSNVMANLTNAKSNIEAVIHSLPDTN
jgi:hypothetical protein